MKYSAPKKNEITKLAGKWMDLVSVILSEVTQSQKGNLHALPVIWNLAKNIFA